MGKYSDYYCSNGNQKLKPIVDRILKRNFGWLPQSEYDECYSIAGQTVWYCEENFDKNKGKSFEKYLIDSLYKKIKTHITYMNRKKRNNGTPNLSIEKIMDDESNMTIGDMIAAKDAVDIHPLAQRYIDSLTRTQRRIAELIMDGYDNRLIKKTLGLTEERFKMLCQRMRANEKTEPLNKLRGA